MSTPLLEAENVGICFGGLQALKGFNLSVKKGDLQGLIGPNGAGKTTAFNIITGVYSPTEGQVRVGGQEVTGRSTWEINRMGLARTFQNIRLFKSLTALDNVKVACLNEEQPLFSRERAAAARAQGRRLTAHTMDAFANYADWWRALMRTRGFQADELRLTERAESLLEVMGLSHRRDELADSLPYGEQRRLEVARALGTSPKVLLLDEPAAGMNTREKADLMSLIRNIRDRFELGILLIEHDMKLVMGICEQITVLDHGQTIATGTPSAVRQAPEVIKAYLGSGELALDPVDAPQEAPRPEGAA